MVRYAPGESVEKAAFAALGASYGRALRDVEVTLPEGLYAVAPTRLDSIPAGGEELVVARMTGTRLSGDVVLRGRVGSLPFERRYPLALVASTDTASAFVPRLYAALRIANLERDGGADTKARRARALDALFGSEPLHLTVGPGKRGHVPSFRPGSRAQRAQLDRRRGR